MAITRSFGGQTLLKPGAYSVSRVDNAQGIAVGENNTLMLIGEASNGNDGSEENSRIFTNIQNLIDYYVSGDIVDAALAAGRPSLTPGISAPTNFIVYKTNVSKKERLFFTLLASPAGNTEIVEAYIRVTFPINASGETYSEIIPWQKPVYGAGAAVTEPQADAVAAAITTALLGNANWNAVYETVTSVSAGLFDQTQTTARIAGPIFASTARGTAIGGRVFVNFFTDSTASTEDSDIVVSAVNTTDADSFNAFAGLGNTVLSGTNSVAPIAGESNGTGTSVVSLTSAFTDAFNFDPNVIVPLWSNAATGLIATNQPGGGIDHLQVTYPLMAAQLQNHLISRSGVAVRKEAQGIFGANDANFETTISTLNTASISSFLVQACIQDVRVIDSLGALTWKPPHIMAAILAGVRLGSTVGEPLTFKVINANGVAHNVNALTGAPLAAATQFRPGFDFNRAIDQGLTFTEAVSGGNRVVVDNTRYAIDESFVFNRGSVIEAAQFVARTSRDLLERVFVGQKVSNGAALSIKNLLRNYLIQLNADNIITSSSDAPFGFVEETFTVTINGNTAAIQVEIKPVQGLDFIFIDFTLGNITQSA